LIYRENGRADRYCGTVYKLSDTPCNHYVTGGKYSFKYSQAKDISISPAKNIVAIVVIQLMAVVLLKKIGLLLPMPHSKELKDFLTVQLI
jgi:hypothetical protein